MFDKQEARQPNPAKSTGLDQLDSKLVPMLQGNSLNSSIQVSELEFPDRFKWANITSVHRKDPKEAYKKAQPNLYPSCYSKNIKIRSSEKLT